MSNERDELAAELYRLEWQANLYATPRGAYTERYERRAERILAAGYRKPEPGQHRYGVFRVSDPIENATPMENMFFDTAKRAQSWIDNGYLQPELWEVREQQVGPWERL